MQKLNNHGSALVGVVAFATILAIVILSTVGLVRNTIESGAQAYDNAQALATAESGLMLGTSWAKDTANWNATTTTPQIVWTGGANGIICTVTVQKRVGPPDSIHVKSWATSQGLAYTKEVGWTITPVAPAAVGASFDGFSDPMTGQNGGLHEVYFYGPSHFNNAMQLSRANSSQLKFYKQVTSASNIATGWASPFDLGIIRNNATGLSDIFIGGYQGGVPARTLGTITGDSLLINPTHVPAGTDSAIIRLDTTGGTFKVIYQYGSGATQKDTISRSSLQGKILTLPTTVRNTKVIGTVNQATRLTIRSSGHVTIVGNVTVDGFTPGSISDTSSNHGIALSNPNALAIVADSSITTRNDYYLNAVLIARNSGESGKINIQKQSGFNGYTRFVGTMICNRVPDAIINSSGTNTPLNGIAHLFYDRRVETGGYAPGMDTFFKSENSQGDLGDYAITRIWTESNSPK